MSTKEPSPTAGMNMAQRIQHVGGRNNPPDSTYVEFGSIQAVEALAKQYLRDYDPLPELTPDLALILGKICFQCIHIVQILRVGGQQINTRAEDEQAAAIYFMLKHYIKDPVNWSKNCNAELQAIIDAHKEKTA